jgi:hypothetical protein
MTKKEEFIELFNSMVKRQGKDQIISYLTSAGCDFFIAPASTRFHGSYEGGLVEHSLNVYECLKDYLGRQRVKDTYKISYSDESIAIVSLLHDFCKINVYKQGKRNVKDDKGVWQSVPTYEYNDRFPYGHGEKSVYMINNFMKLTHEEAFAIRYHMGFSSTDDTKNVGEAFSQFPLAFALSTADMEATYFLEK